MKMNLLFTSNQQLELCETSQKCSLGRCGAHSRVGDIDTSIKAWKVMQKNRRCIVLEWFVHPVPSCDNLLECDDDKTRGTNEKQLGLKVAFRKSLFFFPSSGSFELGQYLLRWLAICLLSPFWLRSLPSLWQRPLHLCGPRRYASTWFFRHDAFFRFTRILVSAQRSHLPLSQTPKTYSWLTLSFR